MVYLGLLSGVGLNLSQDDCLNLIANDSDKQYFKTELMINQQIERKSQKLLVNNAS